MTDNSSSAVGRAAIDAYLDSIEQALIVAHAPRSDRTQVLQDLESQIADMLAQQPSPLTEEMVSAVIAKLERANQDESQGRDLVLKSTIVYGVIAPALVMAFFTAATEGYALVPFGIVAFVYFQYLLIRRVHRYMADAAPESAPAPIDAASNTAQAPC